MLWEDIISKSKSINAHPKQIFREEMQKTLLTAFSQKGFFERLVFQGGTALRLFYGNPRFSEDIDLVFRQDEKITLINIISPKIEKFTKDNFSFLNKISIKAQKHEPLMQRFILKTKGINTSQNIRISIKLAKIPSYYNQPKILDFPPLNPAIRVEEQKEILADKITALGCRTYIKGRDLWDIYYLTEEKKISFSWNLVQKKVKDYNYSIENYYENLREKNKEIKINGTKILSNELKRFLPQSVFKQYSNIFDEIMNKITEKISNKV